MHIRVMQRRWDYLAGFKITYLGACYSQNLQATLYKSDGSVKIEGLGSQYQIFSQHRHDVLPQ